MKFAKELDEGAIPEWRTSYFEYKTGKKKIKAIGKALRNIPAEPSRDTPGTSLRDAPVFSLFRRRPTGLQHVRSNSDHPTARPTFRANDGAERTPKALPINESSPLQTKQRQDDQHSSYGSIIGSPPHSPAMRLKHQDTAPSLELPAPAVESDEDADGTEAYDNPEILPQAHSQMAHQGNAYEIRPAHDSPTAVRINPRLRSLFPKRTNSMPGPFMKRMFSGDGSSDTPRDQDVALEAYREVDFRQGEFFSFLDKELVKINAFYKEKEEDAKERLDELRQQLHIMREFRLKEILAAQAKKGHASTQANGSHEEMNGNGHGKGEQDGHRASTAQLVARPFTMSLDLAADAMDKVRRGHVGKTSKAREDLGTPTSLTPQRSTAGSPDAVYRPREDRGDYVTKAVPYRDAKRKMKSAMAEFYRNLELVKSYAMLNRTAFRKITKKYTKRTGYSTDYMDSKVNTAYFVTSDMVDSLMSTTEDLYARYFEKGHRKVAVSKLRAKSRKTGDYSGSIARSCALLGAGAVLGIEGLVRAAEKLFVNDPDLQVKTSYALQIYGGYFLMWLLGFLFLLDCYIFEKFKVNYQFIFELDKRNALDWKQAIEIPSWLLFLLGLFLWLNFDVAADVTRMYVWWPVPLMGLALLLLFFPFKLFYYRARLWLFTNIWRLLGAPFYPVEFRDFFLGDMFCSLTYVMGNIELFFCLYSKRWNSPAQCNSSHSLLLGFFSALPGVWRALQCLRRYKDNHYQVWPNLVNFGKYCATIMQYVTLSQYRIHKTTGYLIAFCIFSGINSIYCSIWDIFMDFSLVEWPRFRMRKTLVYKKHMWMYYGIIIIDPLLRCNWIPYAVYTKDVQHSTIVSFVIALSEVLRRAMWTLFRVENEQASNIVNKFAARDLPLPYRQKPRQSGDYEQRSDRLDETSDSGDTAGRSSGRDVEAGTESPSKAAFKRIGDAMRSAHTADYQRRKRPMEEIEGEEDEDDDSDDD